MEKLEDSGKPPTEPSLVDRKLLNLLKRRLANYLFRFEVLVNGENTWYVFLVNSYKKQQFLDKVKTGSIKFENFGTILASGKGDLPQEIAKIKATELISNNLIKLTRQKKRYDETYYVLCDPEKKREILEATSAEEIQQQGKILYAGLDTEPAEVTSLATLKGIFNNSSSEIDFKVRNRHIEALWGRDFNKLEEYLGEDANATAVDHNGWNLLHYCALWGDKLGDKEKLIYRLARTKLDASAQDNWGRLPRHIAAKEGRLEVFDFYITKGVGGNKRDCNGWTDMHYAAWKGKSDCVNLLLSKYVPIYVRDQSVGKTTLLAAKDKCRGKTPLQVASEEGHTEIVELLLEWGSGVSDCDDDGETPLFYAAQSGHVETARYLIGRNANVEARAKTGATPLHTAVGTENNADMIELLISHGSKLDSKDDRGRTPLQHAAECGHLNNVQVLVEKGFSESDYDETLFGAAQSGLVELTTFLIGASVDLLRRG